MKLYDKLYGKSNYVVGVVRNLGIFRFNLIQKYSAINVMTYMCMCITTHSSSKQQNNIHKGILSTLWRNQYSRHLWCYSHETSHVYLRCGRSEFDAGRYSQSSPINSHQKEDEHVPPPPPPPPRTRRCRSRE
jgi:hypothetical protein